MTTMYTERDTLHTFEHKPQQDRLVGLHGFAQVGKDTVASLLKDHGYQRVAFADPMRWAMYTLNPVVRADSYGREFRLAEIIDDMGWDEAKTTIPEVRRLLQVFGTEVGRELFGESVWVDLAMKKIKPNGKYVITDARFPDEIVAIAKKGGTLVKITRPGYAPVNNHVSDSGLPDEDFDAVIANDGSLDDLRTKALAAVAN